MSVLVALARLVLAGVFVVSAVAKLRDRGGSREAVQAFGVPLRLVGVVAGGLPFLELTCAALLVLADPAATAGGVVSLLVLVTFTVGVVANLLGGRRPDCHCFGSIGSGGRIGWTTVARNAVLIVLASLSLVGAGELPSAPAVLLDLEGSELRLLGGTTLVGAALLGMGVALYTLMTRYGAVLLRLDALEAATGLAAPPLAPPFALPDLDGKIVTLDDIVSEGRPALLVFISPTCTNCADLLPDLVAWQSDGDHLLNVVVISDGTTADNLTKLNGVGPIQVLLQEGFSTAQAYDIKGTPAAVLLGAEGRRAGQAAHSVGGVRSLHDSVLQAMGAGPAQRRSHEHLHSIEPRPVTPGDALPDVVIRVDDGEEVLAVEAVGEEAVLLFWRTTCGYCSRILDEVRALEAVTPVRLVTSTDVSVIRESGLTSRVLRDPAGALQSWLRVPGTPSAARIRHGSLDSELAVGGPGVLALLQASSRSSATAD